MRPHSIEWYEKIAVTQKGYYYPWKSKIEQMNGEDTFIELLSQQLSKGDIALDVGCGHGELTLDMANLCKEVYAYDCVSDFIDIANTMKEKLKIANVQFILGNSKSYIGNKRIIKVPIDDMRFDVVFSRRGPTNFIEDLLRISKNGTKVIQLNPVPRSKPIWLNELPDDFELYDFAGSEFEIKSRIKNQLDKIGQTIKNCWFFDVPEYFQSPNELYKYLFWYDLENPKYSYSELEKTLKDIFKRYSAKNSIELRHKRFLWTAIIKK